MQPHWSGWTLSFHRQMHSLREWMRRKPSQLTCDKQLILNSSSRWTCFNTFLVNVMLTQQYIGLFDHLIFEAEPSFPCSLREIATARLIRSGNSSRLSITGARTASSHSTVRTQGGNREADLLGGSVSKPFVLPLILSLYRSLSLYLTLESDLHHQ